MGFGFEKHLGKTDPFVIEFTWKFLPGLGCRGGAMTPPCAGQCCCLVPFRRGSGWALFHSCFQGHRAQLREFLPFFRLCIVPILAVHPICADGYPCGQAILWVAPLCPSLWQEFELGAQRFPSSSFWRESPAGDLHVVRSKTRA